MSLWLIPPKLHSTENSDSAGEKPADGTDYDLQEDENSLPRSGAVQAISSIGLTYLIVIAFPTPLTTACARRPGSVSLMQPAQERRRGRHFAYFAGGIVDGGTAFLFLALSALIRACSAQTLKRLASR